jgi:hypothetical protein
MNIKNEIGNVFFLQVAKNMCTVVLLSNELVMQPLPLKFWDRQLCKSTRHIFGL